MQIENLFIQFMKSYDYGLVIDKEVLCSRGEIYRVHKVNSMGSIKLLNFKGWHTNWLYKPILRTIEELTDVEKATINAIESCNLGNKYNRMSSIVKFLDSISVDQRGWIDGGVAVSLTDVRNARCDREIRSKIWEEANRRTK